MTQEGVIEYAPVVSREPIQSWLGVASVACACLGGFVFSAVVVYVSIFGEPGIASRAAYNAIVVCVLVVAVGSGIAGLVVGILGCTQKRRRRSLAAAGIVVSVALLLLMACTA